MRTWLMRTPILAHDIYIVNISAYYKLIFSDSDESLAGSAPVDQGFRAPAPCVTPATVNAGTAVVLARRGVRSFGHQAVAPRVRCRATARPLAVSGLRGSCADAERLRAGGAVRTAAPCISPAFHAGQSLCASTTPRLSRHKCNSPPRRPMKSDTPSYHGYRFPPEIISHAVWLYHRFGVSFRDVEDLLAQRGLNRTE